MAKEKNIKVSGRKTDIIKGILKAVSISSSAVNTVKTELLGSSKDHPIHHLHYRQSFNPIDMAIFITANLSTLMDQIAKPLSLALPWPSIIAIDFCQNRFHDGLPDCHGLSAGLLFQPVR